MLFVLSVGLSVTLGLMNFTNLAHCAFGMVGGYATVIAMNWLGIPFLLGLPIAFLAAAAISIVLERTIFRLLYGSTELSQVLLTIGVVFMASASAAYLFGTAQQPIQIPPQPRLDWTSPPICAYSVVHQVFKWPALPTRP